MGLFSQNCNMKKAVEATYLPKWKNVILILEVIY